MHPLVKIRPCSSSLKYKVEVSDKKQDKLHLSHKNATSTYLDNIIEIRVFEIEETNHL